MQCFCRAGSKTLKKLSALMRHANFYGSWTPFTVNKTNCEYDALKGTEVPINQSFWQYRLNQTF